MAFFSAQTLKFHWPDEGAISKVLADSRRWFEEALQRRKSYNQTVYELSICSNRNLADMGISRQDIRRLAREAAQAKILS
ncbi:MAG: DUF1127 domain-containing protein [Pseudomonadota bacterium]